MVVGYMLHGQNLQPKSSNASFHATVGSKLQSHQPAVFRCTSPLGWKLLVLGLLVNLLNLSCLKFCPTLFKWPIFRGFMLMFAGSPVPHSFTNVPL